MAETNSPDQLRLFIAISLPEAVKAGIEKAQAEFRRALHAGSIRFAKRDQLHLTLKFLGPVAADRLPTLKDALDAACQGFGPLPLSARGIGFFPNARSPRVIWVGVTDAREELLRLQAAVAEAARDFSLEPNEKKFAGHVTLGRAKELSRREAQRLAKLAEEMPMQCFGDWVADSVHLFRSELHPDGAQHTILAEASLADKTAP